MTAPTAPTPVKPIWQSKTVWASVITVFVVLYNAFGPRYGYQPLPGEVLALLGAFGLYGLRTANSTLTTSPEAPSVKAPDNVLPSGTVPADPALPFPGGDGSPLTNLYPEGNGEAVLDDVQPFFGGVAGAVAGAVLGNMDMDNIAKFLLEKAGLPSSKTMLHTLAAKITAMLPDFFDSSPQLSTENLNILNAAILDLKAERGL